MGEGKSPSRVDVSGPPHLAHEWLALTDDEQRDVARWFSERHVLSQAERVMEGQTCAALGHEDYPARSFGIFDDGALNSGVFYCRECCRAMVAAGWYTPLIALDQNEHDVPGGAA